MKHCFSSSFHRKSLPVLDPSGDYYYWWLNTMVFPVMYNLIIIVCRFGRAERRALSREKGSRVRPRKGAGPWAGPEGGAAWKRGPRAEC